jgi:hypothetical protein
VPDGLRPRLQLVADRRLESACGIAEKNRDSAGDADHVRILVAVEIEGGNAGRRLGQRIDLRSVGDTGGVDRRRYQSAADVIGL